MDETESVTTRTARFEEFAEYRRLASIDEIGRRVIANNGFDGILTIIGVLMGSYVAGVQEPRIVVSTGLATCMAIGISGAWGSYMAETAERKHELQELGQALLRDMHGSKQARAARFATLVITALDGLSPFLAGMTMLIPFLIPGLCTEISHCYLASISLAMIELFGLGAFLGKVARESIVRSGLRMILAGIVCIGLTFLLNANG